jgi:uncharacterized protein
MQHMKLTATHGIIAMKGSGKTYRAMATAEQMLDSGGQIVAIDPTGAWWGLRLDADGKKIRYPHLLVLGANGSLPLTDAMGEVVARLVVNQRLSVVLDLSEMPKAGMRRFVTAFLLELYRTNPGRPLHAFVDEADLFAPEGAKGEASHCTGAMSDYFRRGRRKGLGGTLITQRVQAIAKDVLWQCEAMTILRLKGTHDIAAIKDWLDSNGFDAKAIAAHLPKLAKGERYYCGDETAKFHGRADDPRKTFDSSRTPEPGEESYTPPPLDEAAIAKIKGQLGEAVAEIEANDPAKLRAEIGRLKRELAKPKQQAVETKTITVEVPVLDKFDIARLEDVAAKLKAEADSITAALAKVRSAPPVQVRREVPPAAKPRTPERKAAYDAQAATEETDLYGGAKRMLDAIASAGPINRTQLATLAGLSPRSGTFSTYLGKLRSGGYVQEDRELFSLTPKGHANAGTDKLDFDSLRAEWLGKLYGGAKTMMQVLIDQYPTAFTRDELADAANLSPKSGTYSTYLGKLRGNCLVNEDGGAIRASDALFGV